MRVLVIRLSAMGDVALLVPVIQEVLHLNPKLEICLVTRKAFAALFAGIPRLVIYTPDLKGRHRGVWGLLKLSKDLKSFFLSEAVCDLHDVLRSKVLRLMLAKKLSVIDKQRGEKKRFIKEKTTKKQLLHTTERYINALAELGLKTPRSFKPRRFIQVQDQELQWAEQMLAAHRAEYKNLIGLAPFAKHFTKTWPLDKVRDLLTLLENKGQCRVLLFGGGAHEVKLLETLAGEFPCSFSVAGKYRLAQELALISKLRLMVVMDSANMHFSSLLGVPTFSLWGGTHPKLGFAPLAVEPSKIIQKDLDCRPCSAFGREECPLEHFNCLNSLEAIEVYEALDPLL